MKSLLICFIGPVHQLFQYILEEGQCLAKVQTAQRGFRASQTLRPCWIKRWEMVSHSSFGMIFTKSCSILTASWCLVHPRRLLSRVTWVSTVIPTEMP